MEITKKTVYLINVWSFLKTSGNSEKMMGARTRSVINFKNLGSHKPVTAFIPVLLGHTVVSRGISFLLRWQPRSAPTCCSWPAGGFTQPTSGRQYFKFRDSGGDQIVHFLRHRPNIPLDMVGGILLALKLYHQAGHFLLKVAVKSIHLKAWTEPLSVAVLCNGLPLAHQV